MVKMKFFHILRIILLICIFSFSIVISPIIPEINIDKSKILDTFFDSLDSNDPSLPSTPTSSTLPYNEWYCIGPFDKDDLTFENNTGMNLNQTFSGMRNMKIQWKKAAKEMKKTPIKFSLAKMFSLKKNSSVAAYFFTSINSPLKQKHSLKIAPRRINIKAWLNGIKVPLKKDILDLRLNKGENELFLQISWVHRNNSQIIFTPGKTEIDSSQNALTKINENIPDELKEPLHEYSRLNKLLKERKSNDSKHLEYRNYLKSHVFSRDSLLSDTDRDPLDIVLRRTKTLLNNLSKEFKNIDLSKKKVQLKDLIQEASLVPMGGRKRLEIMIKVGALKRRIAFANPLLNFNKIIFLKHHKSKANHMCDQYFGFTARKGGGIYILDKPFNENPRIRDLLTDSVVQNGRLKGKKLKQGSFISLELSYDSKTVLFAWTQAADTRNEWTPESTYHIFKVNIDGSKLIQLTDGPWNDFDPCFLPNHRIVFISERRGGYGRCHPRPVPSYTLHSMNPDGTGITVLSPHETNEWHPSINNNGMIVYTRWDYVDRGFNQSHHPWITYPNGRDSRAIHGIFKEDVSHNPCMEMDVRAIPGSHKYVATAAAHHGQAYGSFVLIDPKIHDNHKMSPLSILTPDAKFPESTTRQGDDQKYATAWPLSEQYYLCVYDEDGKGSKQLDNNYGIYLLDAGTGDKTLIYRDPEISCLSPIPLRPRKKPPIIPDQVSIEEKFSSTGTIGILDVYKSTYPFPGDTKIKYLRIIQILPKTTYNRKKPRIGYGEDKSARAVLGTVPVEEDGSVFFTLPAHKPIFFQALDENEEAVQSMRSATYIKPNEQLFCIGCHEPQKTTPELLKAAAAFKRGPSVIKPDVEGSNPFSFPRLVQPVLDKSCVSCHQKNLKKAPDLRAGNFMNNANYWYTSYLNLKDYAFYYTGRRWDTPVTIPGKFGARASKLYNILNKGHHGVDLSKQDMHRLTLWLECNSDFFGSYENTGKQAQGKVVQTSLE